MIKNKLRMIFLLFLSLGLVACGKAEDTQPKNTSTSDLLSSLDEEKSKEDEKLINELEKLEENQKDDSKEESKESDKEKEPDIRRVNIKAFGDIMAHKAQIDYAYNRGPYDFSESFEYVRDFVADSDISIGNYETTTNPNLPYAGFPRFNAPIDFLYEIKKTGFDILSTANNHSLDTGEEGLFTTMDAIDQAGLSYVGSFRQEDEKILLKEVNGVKFAFLAYTYGCNGLEDLIVPRAEVANLSYLTDKDQIKADVKAAKATGADFIVVYPHWGIEYQSYPDISQIELGRSMIDWGADLVIGNHPHVVQPVERYEAEDGRDGLIAYALGNFISFQNLENNGDIRVEHSLALDIDLSFDRENNTKTIEDVSFHPLWVGSYYDDYGVNIKTYLAEDFLEGGAYENTVSEQTRSRIKKAYDMTMETANTEVN